MTTLTEFLLARIAEDEAVAREITEPQWRAGQDWTMTSDNWTLTTGSTRTVFVCCAEDVAAGMHDDGRGIGVASRVEVTHIARHDPARILAECEAKRRIVEVHHPHDHGGEHGDAVFCDECQWDHGDDSPRIDNQPVDGFGTHPCRTLAALALPYADHPDYRDEWRP